MDWLTFISKIFESSAWPIAVIIIVMILRLPLAQLVALLRKLKYKDLELDFAERLEKVETEAEQAELPPPPPVYPGNVIWGIDLETRKSLRQLAVTSPRAAIGEAWRQLESAIRDALERQGVAPFGRIQTTLELARSEKILPHQIMSLVEEMRVLRNKAVHERDFALDVEQAMEYIGLSERIISSFGPLKVDIAGAD